MWEKKIFSPYENNKLTKLFHDMDTKLAHKTNYSYMSPHTFIHIYK